ncbi:McrB family protein [Curtobacterium sp. MCPF17_046]|uniref:McrB family protein n=1 Tax=Curtobacterium sp. MCPF17_046 TaxID=2175663 RepID=UPI000D8FFEB0|nr:AAA family ATPase [Curtobacterium sp. MCPF17_046]PYY34471.1 ATPase [Curtobacterium sp. MCPF17_046]
MADAALTPIPLRQLDADDLSIGVAATVERTHASNSPAAPALDPEDPMLALVVRLLPLYGGVIFTGPPGTGKSFKAAQIAEAIAGDKARTEYVQFHASYQYEDFMEGFAPDPVKGGFSRKDGVFLRMCKLAGQQPDERFVLVIDELSRADAARVFGEALTYVERTKRGQTVTLPSGRTTSVPGNLEILATMNPIDRGVDEVDAAFERRFAKIRMDPERSALDAILEDNGVDDALKQRVLAWFSMINKLADDNPAAAVGHAYFVQVDGVDSLRDLWAFQLQYLVGRAFRLDPEGRTDVETGWRAMFRDVDGGWDGLQPPTPGAASTTDDDAPDSTT